METTLTKEKENVVILNMTIPANEADSAYSLAANRISQNININGFRRGKAPKSVVERHVGVDRIQHEALDMLLPKYISKAIFDNKLDTITQPALIGYNFEQGQDLKVTIEVETRPEFELGAYKDLTLNAEINAEESDAFDKALNNYLTQNSSLELVLDRPSKEDDIVVFDFDGVCNGEKIQGGSAKSYTLDLAHSNFIAGFAEQLVGHNIKDEFDIEVTFPQDYRDEKLKGQKATFSIKINEIKQRVLPELTDELVKKTTRFSTVDELKSDIQEFLNNQRESMKKVSAENAVFKSVTDSTNIDIPQTMINREVDAIVSGYQQRVGAQGINWEEFLKSQGGENNFLDGAKEEAKVRIKNSLIIDRIAKDEKITVEREDFTNKLSQISAAYGATPDVIIKQFGQNPQFINSLSQQILNDKVRDFLIENNKFEYVEIQSQEEENSDDASQAAKESKPKAKRTRKPKEQKVVEE